jgi:O-antigen ligase
MWQEIQTVLAYENTHQANFTEKLRPGSTQIRYMLYKSSFELVRESPVIGYGAGDVKRELSSKLKDNNFTSISHLGYGTHSQFIYEILAHGILGLLIFIVLFISFIINNKNSHFETKYGFILILITFCTFESYFNSRAGIIPGILFLNLFGIEQISSSNTK